MSDPELLTEIRRVRAEAECLFNPAQVEGAIAAAAISMCRRLRHSNPLCLCVMNGGLIFTGKLLPYLDFPLELDYIHVTRYRDKTSGGELNWLRRPERELQGRTVLIIDDILDEGLTLQAVLDYCIEAGAAETIVAVLSDKQRERAPGGLTQADFTVLELPDRYVFGYGLDYKGYLRNAPGVFAVKGM